MLGTILRHATREDTFNAIEQHFAKPLGMEDFTAKDGEYVYVPASTHPAYHLYFTAKDLARFGWMFLNGGRWSDRQIVPPPGSQKAPRHGRRMHGETSLMDSGGSR